MLRLVWFSADAVGGVLRDELHGKLTPHLSNIITLNTAHRVSCNCLEWWEGANAKRCKNEFVYVNPLELPHARMTLSNRGRFASRAP